MVITSDLVREKLRQFQRGGITQAALVAWAEQAMQEGNIVSDATDAEAALQSMSWHHWLGTDIYGRDLLSRIIFAARVDLTVAFGATATAHPASSTSINSRRISPNFRGLVAAYLHFGFG